MSLIFSLTSSPREKGYAKWDNKDIKSLKSVNVELLDNCYTIVCLKELCCAFLSLEINFDVDKNPLNAKDMLAFSHSFTIDRLQVILDTL